MEFNEAILRFSIAFFSSFLYGFYRQKTKKPIGFGTFIFVTVGACGLTIAALDLGLSGATVPLLSAIVTGIGFLGAGALIRNSDRVFGFTAAAAIWLFAIFGMLIGLREFLSGFIVYLVVWFVVFFDMYLEKKGVGSYRRKIVVECNKLIDKKEIAGILAGHCNAFHLVNMVLNKKERVFVFSYSIEGATYNIESLVKALSKKEWCSEIKLE